MAWPTTEPLPITRLSTPLGSPARWRMSTIAHERARHEVGRLEHHRVAVAERRRDLPGRDGDREIPRRDDADDADRLARDLDADAGPDRRHGLARQPQRLAGEELEDLRRRGSPRRCPRAGSCPPRGSAARRAPPCARRSRARSCAGRPSAPAAPSATRPGTPPWPPRWRSACPPPWRGRRRPRPRWCWTD